METSEQTEEPKRIGYIEFQGRINALANMHLTGAIRELLQDNCDQIKLVLSTPGGSVKDGLVVHNYLRSAPARIVTHNMGAIDSIGNVIFAAGDLRYSSQEASFLFHPINMNMQGRFTKEELLEEIGKLDADQAKVTSAITHATGISKEEVERLTISRTSLTSEQAKEKGIVHEVRGDLFPAGVNVRVIHNF